MDWTPETNRIQTWHLKPTEIAALADAKHGLLVWDDAKGWQDLVGYPFWAGKDIYRAKPAPRPTIICNGVEVPEPVRVALADGTKYYVAAPLSEKWFIWNPWDGDKDDLFYLGRGLIHLTEADAVSHAKAMAKAGCV